MKKILVLIITLIFLLGCGSDEKKNNTADETEIRDSSMVGMTEEFESASEVDPQTSFNLTYSIPVGEKYNYKLTSVATTNQKITADSTIENEVTQTIQYIFQLESKGQKNNITTLDVTIESVNISANFNGEIINYDSKAVNNEETNLRFAEYSSLPNKTLQIDINAQGRIQEIRNIEEIVKRYLEIQKANSITDEERVQLNTQLKEQALQPLLQQVFRYVPEKETKIDSSWDLVYESPMGLYNLTNTARSTLKNVVKKDDDLLARFLTSLSVEYEGDGFVQQGDVTYQFDEPKITGDAVTYFNLDKRIVQKSELTAKTEINVLVTASNPNTGKETATRTDLSVNRNTIELIEN